MQIATILMSAERDEQQRCMHRNAPRLKASERIYPSLATLTNHVTPAGEGFGMLVLKRSRRHSLTESAAAWLWPCQHTGGISKQCCCQEVQLPASRGGTAGGDPTARFLPRDSAASATAGTLCPRQRCHRCQRCQQTHRENWPQPNRSADHIVRSGQRDYTISAVSLPEATSANQVSTCRLQCRIIARRSICQQHHAAAHAGRMM